MAFDKIISLKLVAKDKVRTTSSQVWENIRRIMKVRGYNYKTLGEKWGRRSGQNVGQKLSGKRELTISDIAEITEILKVPPETVFFDFSDHDDDEFKEMAKLFSWSSSLEPKQRSLIIQLGVEAFQEFQSYIQPKKPALVRFRK